MITTATGMHVRRIVKIDKKNDLAIVRGFGSPEQRLVDRQVKLSELKATGGIEEIRKNRDQFRKES